MAVRLLSNASIHIARAWSQAALTLSFTAMLEPENQAVAVGGWGGWTPVTACKEQPESFDDTLKPMGEIAGS